MLSFGQNIQNEDEINMFFNDIFRVYFSKVFKLKCQKKRIDASNSDYLSQIIMNYSKTF